MKQIVTILFAILLARTSPAATIWDYEAVDSQGVGTHPLVVGFVDGHFSEPTEKVTVEGVALAGVNELLDPSSQYTVFIQDTSSDRGGLQAWAGGFFYGALWPQFRATYYRDFAAGDRVRITGYLADAKRGKVVINHLHSTLPDYAFDVTVLDHPGLPDPELVSGVSSCNYFDSTRDGGGERRQTRLVMLHGVEIDSGSWASGQTLAVSDGSGSIDMLLSAMGDFTGSSPTGRINVVGILDQEDTVMPITEQYRVWVKKTQDLAVALDSCREIRTRANGDRIALINKIVSRVYDGYFYAQDLDRSGGVRVSSGRRFEVGDVICVQGTVSSFGDEKIVDPTYLARGRAPAGPLMVASPALWNESGLDAKGLLVKCVVAVGTEQGNGTFSALDDAGRMIYIKSNGVALPSEGTQIAITSVLRFEGGAPLLDLACSGDVQVLP